jgi:hypothetical protein
MGIDALTRRRPSRAELRDRAEQEAVARRFLCIDCGKSTLGGEYYMVGDDLWAASGVAPNGGMLCLACLETRIRRPLTIADFTAILPSAECWERHVALRPSAANSQPPGLPEQLDLPLPVPVSDADAGITRRSC